MCFTDQANVNSQVDAGTTILDMDGIMELWTLDR
jgi:hypothetical protein